MDRSTIAARLQHFQAVSDPRHTHTRLRLSRQMRGPRRTPSPPDAPQRRPPQCKLSCGSLNSDPRSDSWVRTLTVATPPQRRPPQFPARGRIKQTGRNRRRRHPPPGRPDPAESCVGRGTGGPTRASRGKLWLGSGRAPRAGCAASQPKFCGSVLTVWMCIKGSKTIKTNKVFIRDTVRFADKLSLPSHGVLCARARARACACARCAYICQ